MVHRVIQFVVLSSGLGPLISDLRPLISNLRAHASTIRNPRSHLLFASPTIRFLLSFASVAAGRYILDFRFQLGDLRFRLENSEIEELRNLGI